MPTAKKHTPASTSKLRIFVSSVQKELELERAAIATVISTDPFLLKHCEPVLFEMGPPPARPAAKPYLDALRSCQIYLLIVDCEYGNEAEGLSATHEEYRLAQDLKMPTIVLVKGDSHKDASRRQRTQEMLKEIKKAGHTYRRFHDREDLKPIIREALLRVLADEYQTVPSSDEDSDGEHLIEMTSPFEACAMTGITAHALDANLLAPFVDRVFEKIWMKIWDDSSEQALVSRGLAIPAQDQMPATVTHAAFVLFAPKPANRLPQCEILLDAYDDTRISGRPKGQETINAPIFTAVEQVLRFVDSHTLHPRRVVGLNNIRLDEYPVKALREALINALAHRNYEDATRKVMVRIFSDRLEIASPGYPLKPLTLARLRKGNYRPCSRNPLIAQTLALLDQMEQRGTGFARMHDAMLDHGLDAPALSESDGYFVVTLPGPNGNYDRLRVPLDAVMVIPPSVEGKLTSRQARMVELLVQGEELTSRFCQIEFSVSAPIIAKDFTALIELGLAEKIGSGRSTRYRFQPPVIIK